MVLSQNRKRVGASATGLDTPGAHQTHPDKTLEQRGARRAGKSWHRIAADGPMEEFRQEVVNRLAMPTETTRTAAH
jgi:hypothetical protein